MDLLIIFLIGVGASFFGSFMSGGVSIISFSLLSLYGLPAIAALGIFRVGIIGFQTGGLIKYVNAKKIVWKRTLPLIVIGSIGVYIGGKIILSININQDVLSQVMGFAILFSIPLALLKPEVGI